MGNTLDTPSTAKDSHEYLLGGANALRVGVAAMQGWRPEMEDMHVCADITSFPHHTLLAIFDGHGGRQSAEYAKHHIMRVLKSRVSWVEYTKSADWAVQPETLGKALAETFIQLDLEMSSSGELCYRRSGCTALVCVVTPSHVICANAGDCRAVLGQLRSDENALDTLKTDIIHIDLSTDHKPSNLSELKRIEAAGHVVNFGRVDADLAISRGLGDHRLKDAHLKPPEQAVTCVPDISMHIRTHSLDLVLLLACDGLFDVISSEQAMRRVLDIFQLGEVSAALVAEEMVDGALYEGKSRDNISAIVCIFSAGKHLLEAVRASSEMAIGVAGIRLERRLAGRMNPDYDMYDNVELIPPVEPAPGSMFYSADY